MALLSLVLGGLAAAALVAGRGEIGGRDAVVLLALSGGGAGAVGAATVGLLHFLRRSSVGLQTGVAVVAPVMVALVGIAGASGAMFISAHDRQVLTVVLILAGTVGVLTALFIGERVALASRHLGDLARRLDDDANGTGVDDPGPCAASPLRAPPGELARLAEQLEDTRARLAQSRSRSAAMESSRRQLIAWVSHDLRTPLAGIRAMVEALEDGVVDDPATVARYYATIGAETDRLAGLVDDLFELSRIQAAALNLDFESISIADLVSDALAGVSPAADAKGVRLSGYVSSPAPVAELSIREMSRVVRNLLDNAIRHTPQGGAVRVEATLGDDSRSAVVSVLDGCGGIPAADLPRVFELAYRGDFARTPGDAGAGLGLAVARGLVEAHRGQISVDNEADGCRFTVRIPVAVNRLSASSE